MVAAIPPFSLSSIPNKSAIALKDESILVVDVVGRIFSSIQKSDSGVTLTVPVYNTMWNGFKFSTLVARG